MPAALPPLLHGPYRPLSVQVGDRTHCYLRDALVVITSWSDALITWPRCQPVGQRGGSGLLLDGDLIRAVKSESAQAVMAHWGVTAGVVWRWRKVLGVTNYNNLESQKAIREAAKKGAMTIKARGFAVKE